MPSLQDRFPIHPSDKKGRFRRAWRESHGNALMGFAVAIFVVGMIVIWTTPPPLEEPQIDLNNPLENPVVPELPAETLVIRVATSQIESAGPIRVAVYDSKDAFGNPDKAIIKNSFLPIQGFAVWDIKLEILPEKFAIAAYHDLDNNGQLNRALFNAPVEPYGFSNNARSLIGPPTYEQTIMQRPNDSMAIEIRVY